MKRRAWARFPPAVVWLLASLAAVAVVTAAIEVLEPFVPVLSLGVLYVFAVLPIAIAFGMADAIAVAVGSMLAFNPAVVVAEIAQALGAELVAAGHGSHCSAHDLVARLRRVPGVDVLLTEAQ